MNASELRERALGVRGRLLSFLGRKWFLPLVVLSCLYVTAYIVLSTSAQYRRQVDFYGNGGKTWVELGSHRFTPDGWEAFMGSVFHPVLFWILALPALVVAALAASAVVVVVLGLVGSALDRQAEAKRRREQMQHELEKQRIEADRRRPTLFAVGSSGAAAPSVRRLCSVCDSDVDGSGPGCPNCGAPWLQA